MIRVHSKDGVLRYRRDPYALDLLPGSTIHDKVGAPCVFFEKRQKPRNAAGPQSAHAASPTSTVSESPGSRKYATVSFKFGQGLFFAPFRIAVGDHVVVEAVGGTIAVGVVSTVYFELPAACPRPLFSILRHVRVQDHSMWAVARANDGSACVICQNAANRLNIVTTALDVEWQVGGSAITCLFAFRTSQPVDVDELHTVLVDIFRCRVFILTVNSQHSSSTHSLSASSRSGSEHPEPIF